MEKSTNNIKGILGIIKLLHKTFPNVNIGEYNKHYICEDNTYKVFLNNNTTIKIHRTTAQDAEININCIEKDSLQRIINSYTSI